VRERREAKANLFPQKDETVTMKFNLYEIETIIEGLGEAKAGTGDHVKVAEVYQKFCLAWRDAIRIPRNTEEEESR
jgi:hypothetical protein